MRVDATVPGDDEERDSLRRRLYAPDATDADREAYLAAESADDPQPVAAPAPTRRIPLRVRLVAIAGSTLLVAAGVVVLATGHPLAQRSPGPGSTAPAGTVPVPATVRDRFVRDLRAGVDPGLLAYLDGHPETLLAALRTAGRADSTEYTGVGPTTAALSPTTIAERAGHVTVVLVTDRDLGYDWRATKVAESNDRSGPEPPVASHDGRVKQGEPVSGTVGYSGGVPTRLTLLVPNGARWAAVVVYSD